MAVYQRIFTIASVGRVHRLYHEALRLTEEIELAQRQAGLGSRASATRAQLLRSYGEFNDSLNVLARRTAADADAKMRRKLRTTARRPNTGLSPHLEQLLRSRPIRRFGPIATGEVGVADEAWLDRAINPTAPQYGPYWRAQEFGTGAGEVPSQVGRVIRGYFFGPGLSGATPPLAQYAGGRGPHPIFVSGRAGKMPKSVGGGIGPGGGAGGFGTIQHEIHGRHFIRDGANAALIDWRAGVRRVELDAVRSLQGLVNPRPRGRVAAAARRRRRL